MMSNQAQRDAERDDGRIWGYLDEDGTFRPLPKYPMLMAELGPPPFAVTLPDQRVRNVVHDPNDMLQAIST